MSSTTTLREDSRSVSEKDLEDEMTQFRRYLTVKRGLTTKTANQHVMMARVFLRKVDSLTPTDEDVMLFREDMMMEGDYSNSHINNTQNAVEYFFAYQDREQELDDYDTLPRKRTDPSPFTNDELERMLDAATRLRDEALLRFLISSGARNSAVTKLDFENLDLDNRTAKIEEAKGNNEYTAVFSDECAEALRRYKRIRGVDESDPVFVSRSGSRLTRSGLLQAVKRIGERADVDNVYAHRFRATFANRLRRSGADLYRIQQLMGHDDMRSTARYLTMDEDELRDEHDKLLNSITSKNS